MLAVLLVVLPVASAWADETGQSLVERYPSGSIDTAEKAKAALDEIDEARAAITRFYLAQKMACYDRFFAASCLTDVRQNQRVAQTAIRKIEVEANALLRKEKAAERDRALAERDQRAQQEPGGRSRPITGVARQPAAEEAVVPDLPADAKP